MNSLTLNSYNKYAKDYFASSNIKIIHKYIEKPAMYEKIPNLTGKKVLCIGCGTGEECLEMYKKGAKEIVGVDESFAMLDIAKSKYGYLQNITFICSNFLNLEQGFNSFDFIYSSLTLHYEPNLSQSINKIDTLLKNSGMILFSISHPIRSSFQEQSVGKTFFKGIGTIQLNTSEKETVFGDYFDSSLKEETWMLGKFNYNYYHFTFEQIFKALKENNFITEDVIEPKPIQEIPESFPEKYSRYPTILIVRATKKSQR